MHYTFPQYAKSIFLHTSTNDSVHMEFGYS